MNKARHKKAGPLVPFKGTAAQAKAIGTKVLAQGHHCPAQEGKWFPRPIVQCGYCHPHLGTEAAMNADPAAALNKSLGLPWNTEPQERVFYAMDLRTLEVLQARVQHEQEGAEKRLRQAELDVMETGKTAEQLRKVLTWKRKEFHPLNVTVKAPNGHQ